MTDIAIKVENLSKCYQIYEKPRDRLLQMLARGHKQFYREFWALKDVSFEIQKGETVGIIGRNGSGKSTLLQMICGTLNPTSGTVQTNGRIAALLELGSGFNPEFTGRENVYMNGAVLGLSREEIDQRFNDIAAFAEIGNFIEQPVKTYSSGMMIRLAFAVAINVDPEILIVDEALAVGDELFQRKCFSRIESIRASGATILFVSHSGTQIIELCDRALLMDAGENLAAGLPKQIVGRYQKLLYAPADKRPAIREQIQRMSERVLVTANSNEYAVQQFNVEHDNQLKESFDPNLKPSSTITYESNGAYIQAAELLNYSGGLVNTLVRGRSYRYTYTVHFTKDATNVRFGLMIKTTSGVELGGGVTAQSGQDSLAFVVGGTQIKVEFQFKCMLNAGVYFLNAGVVGSVNGTEIFLHRLTDAAMFRVLHDTDSLATGIVDFNCIPEILI